MTKIVLPNSTVGVFGSGQLGRMFAIEARKMGYRVHTYSPGSDTPTGQVADIETTADYEDLYAVREFAASVDVVTFEFENVPSPTVDAAASLTQVYPSGDVLHTTQNRLREKAFLTKGGFPIAPYRPIESLVGLEAAVDELGMPSVLKTAGFGYDGKGQFKITHRDDIGAAYASLGGQHGVLEAFVDFEREVSVVCARGRQGEFRHYGVIENTHADHILDVSVSPAGLKTASADRAVDIARSIAEAFTFVGTMCVEFFVTRAGELLVNEIAPRPHNSGHFTFDACVTSQFEQQLRAVCGLPLGSTEQFAPSAMANLLGQLWSCGEPIWERALGDPAVKLHLYGKLDAQAGRKMGHLTAMASSADVAAERVVAARAALTQ